MIATRDLSKRYGAIFALDRATIAVPPGCTGLLGPNGAGKSTLIKLLLGLLQAGGGTARLEGLDQEREPLALRRLVGYMPEHDCLPGDWQSQDFVQYMAQLHGLPRRAAIERASDILFLVGLGEERYRAMGGFSTGMRQRVKLAQALVHDPRVVLLDEPTNGLDPQGRDEMLALIRRVVDEMGINVLVSSHLLADIERVAAWVVILSGGRVTVQGSLPGLAEAAPVITVRTHGTAAALAGSLRERGYRVAEAGVELEVEASSPAVYDAIRDAAVATDSALLHLRRRTLSLEDVYLSSVEGAAEGRDG
ncbi:MAG: ABC transporter ATP-binding protein [Chloroflexi bacterium]|nr:ABC transporter ATP-binding protein [Chloroflexota bacterium]